ncbi:hypothetical protein ATO12_08160 [Aquimarina atlantica]|uniref:Uncharacterized protein n=1 Tax=Aquimarina atlantica TaxID=1317122 RepID=A0A023BNS5_9FLAO|nr:response regulator [Aquimarina atlantica]EZH71353.1 hypothetical protein ATO12_08160 [Aquimarina atlantica]
MLNYIIVDDEPIAHDIIISHAKNLSSLSLVGQAYNAFEAIELLRSKSIDLIFLDIEMPQFKGLDFLKTLNNAPKVIVTTAYEEYALKGYELNIVDYLLKPFSFERFMKAVNKVAIDKTSEQNNFSENAKTLESIFVKENNTTHHIKVETISVLESIGNYVKIYSKDRTIITHQTLLYFEQKLSEINFIRVHKSFIINLKHVYVIEGNHVLIENRKIPIGRTYKMNLSKRIHID